ncbi:MAG: hypothetical protein LBD31_09000 [Treponema sp.]|jgi:hypothetical protein|nr:hypothetical protein [Treponema sp.]
MGLLRRIRRLDAGKHLVLAVLLPGVFLFSAEAQEEGEKHRREITEEASSQLFRMDLRDAEVSLFMKGYWKGSLGAAWGLASSPLGTVPETGDSPVLFTQEADLTLSLWIWERWFLEAGFLDNYGINTYRAGYQGFPGETVQYVGAGNTGLDFPVFSYLDLGGDSPSSFGIYGRFGSEELTFHTLLRYDAAAREERTFTGNRERSFAVLSPVQSLRGRSFVLPDENIPSLPVVYFEDKNGGLSGGGRHWRAAKPSEYAVSARYGVVELLRPPQGMAAVSYGGLSGGGSPGMGNYADPPGTGNFLPLVQEYFDDTRSSIKLEDYPQPGESLPGTMPGRPGTLLINGVWALVIYEPGTFSPFERQSRYQAPSNTSEEAALVRISSGERAGGYEVVPVNSISLPLDSNLYSLTGDDTNRGLFEILASGVRDRRSPRSMWPLDEYPEMYLPGTPGFTGDLRIRFTNYGQPGAYTIGTDVVPGSVQVYRGGIIDSQASYDPGSGTVILASPPGFSEIIRVSYLKRSEERRLGSLAAGAGMIYAAPESPFSAEAALGLRWNVSPEAYTEEGASSPGTAGLTVKTSWEYEKLKTSLSLGLAFEQPDTTGLYRAAGMEGHSEIVLGIPATAGFISGSPADSAHFSGLTQSRRRPLVYRNYRQNNFLGGSELKPVDWNAPVVSGMEGPYPALAPEINTEVFTAEFENLPAGGWTGFQAPLGTDGALLENAREIVIPFRFYQLSPADLKLYVQFGTLADEDSGGVENPFLIVTREIFPDPLFHRPDPKVSGWYLGIVNISDQDRRKLQSARYMRIIIEGDAALPGPVSGRLLAARPYIRGASWRAVTVDSVIRAAPDTLAKAVELPLELPWNKKTERLRGNGLNHVLRIEWNGVGSAGADGRTSVIPLVNYRMLSFYLAGDFPAGSVFHFLVARGPESYGVPGETALELAMPLEAGNNPFAGGGWRHVEIRYGRDKRLLVDGKEYRGSIDYRPAAAQGPEEYSGGGQSSYAAAFFTGPGSSSGSFAIDEICLEDPSPAYRLNTGASLDWNHPGDLLVAGERTVLSGLSFNTALESALRGDPFDFQADPFGGIQSRSRGEATLLGVRLLGGVNLAASPGSFVWNAGHGISRSFGPLSLAETFNTDPAPGGETLDHRFVLGLGTPLYGNLSSVLGYQNSRLHRSWNAAAGMNPKQGGHPGFTLEGNLNYTEKTGEISRWTSNYAAAWAKSWISMVPDPGAGSEERFIQNRGARAKAGFTLDLLPVGADLSFEGSSEVSIPLEQTRSSSTARILFPFAFGPFRGSLRSERGISRSLIHAGEDAAEDLYLYGTGFRDTAPLWKRIPVFAIFDSGLEAAMDEALEKYGSPSDGTRFNEVLALNMLFPERYDLLSLLFPVSFFVQTDRTMERRLDTILDVLTMSAGFSFSALNLFGAMGAYPVLRFYKNEELRHSISAAVSMPRSEDPLWRIRAEQAAGFFGFRGAELELNNAFTISSTGWADSLNLSWTIPAERTLLSALYGAGMKKIAGGRYFPAVDELAISDYERFHRETLELSLDHSGAYGIYQAALGHESVVRVLGRLTLTAFVKLNLRRNRELRMTSLLLNFGTTLNVSF